MRWIQMFKKVMRLSERGIRMVKGWVEVFMEGKDV